MKIFSLLVGLLVSLNLLANDPSKYHTIYDKIIYKYEIVNTRKIILEVTKEYTVYNDKGKYNLLQNIYQDEGIKIENAEVSYIKNGKVDKSYKLKDFMRIVIDESVASTSANSVIGYETQIYPIKVRLNYKVSYQNYYNLPIPSIIRSHQEFASNIEYEVITPKEIDLRYKAIHFTPKSEVLETDKKKIYKFKGEDIHIADWESGQPSEFPQLLLNHSEFHHHGLIGSNKSYEDLSKFMWELWKTENKLPDEHVSFLKDLTKEATTDYDKTKIVYKYLQDNFRYISVQLGIGGIKTISAEKTFRNKYGDCKGLSNYMYSALKALGIESYPVVIDSDSDPNHVMSEDFVFDYSNHIVLLVPNKGDTLWLECTSKSTDFGYLGYSNENKWVYPIMESGGKLIPTPKSKPESSQYHNLTFIQIDEKLTANVNQLLRGTGMIGMRNKSVFMNSKTQIASYLFNYMKWKQPQQYAVGNSDLNNIRLNLQIENFQVAKSGSLSFFTLVPYRNFYFGSLDSATRKKDLLLSHPFIENDTIIYQIPEGFVFERYPENVKIESKWVNYSSRIEIEAEKKQMKVINCFKLLVDRISKEDYTEFRNTMEEIGKYKFSRFAIKKEG